MMMCFYEYGDLEERERCMNITVCLSEGVMEGLFCWRHYHDGDIIEIILYWSVHKTTAKPPMWLRNEIG